MNGQRGAPRDFPVGSDEMTGCLVVRVSETFAERGTHVTTEPGYRAASGTGELLAGRYLLLGRIGRGGMADVFRARDERLGRDVAVKVLRDETSAADTLRRVRVEATALATLNHPALVTLHDAATDDDGPLYLVMELVDGRSLAEERLSASALAAVCADVAGALDHIHSRGMVHRDVKPGNVLVVDERGGARGKLADLGIALIAGSTRLTAAGSVMGTAAYLSPEQVKSVTVTAATDIYSLGLVMVEGLTGTRAFPGTAGESLSARLVRAPSLPPGLADADAALLTAMTSVDPEERPDAAAVEAALRNWSSDSSGPATVTGDPDAATVATDTPTLSYSPARTSAAVATEPATERVSGTGEADARGSRASERSGRTRTLAVTAAALVAIAAIAGIVATNVARPEPIPTRSYPAVEGEIGEHLQQLQELVGP